MGSRAPAGARRPQWPQGDYASPPTFAVVRALAAACLPLIAGTARELGVSRSGAATLLLTWSRPEAPGAIGRSLGLTASAMTTVVADLVRAGFATRAPHPDDGRRAVVAITEPAQDALLTALRPLRVQLDEVDSRFGAARSRTGRAFVVRAARALEHAYALGTCGPDDPDGDDDTVMALLRFTAVVPPMLATLAASLGISRSEMDAALVFAEQPSGPGDLALRLGVTASAGSQVVERLIARGFATRAPDPADGRRVAIALSDAFLTTMRSRTQPFQEQARVLDAEFQAHDLEIGRAFADSATAAMRNTFG